MEQAAVAGLQPAGQAPVLHQGVGMGDPAADLLDLLERLGVEDQVLPVQQGGEQRGREVRARMRGVVLALQQPVQALGGQAKARRQRRLLRVAMVQKQDASPPERPVGPEQRLQRDAPCVVGSREQEHGRLAGGQESRVGLTLDAPELGEASAGRLVLQQEGVEQRRRHIGRERQGQDQPLVGTQLHLPDQLGIGPAGEAEVGGGGGEVRREHHLTPVTGKAGEHDLVEPRQFGLDCEGVGAEAPDCRLPAHHVT